MYKKRSNLYNQSLNAYFNKNRNNIDKKEYYCVKLSHIDYMIYDIHYGDIISTQYLYFRKYSLNRLKEILEKRLLDFANSEKFRDIKFGKNKN